MLYTFSKAYYDWHELQAILDNVNPEDCIVLWQDGVLQAVKYPEIFANLPVYLLANDVMARGLCSHPAIKDYPKLSLKEFVEFTVRFFPQFAL
ncbi:tRNA 2-thiouridine synthesizing protein B [Nicoletella semolina]|uniref:tRNA 2-thiouridine synthesizing protein B n=1 Tax=Nicoletella semolina TaxID=271160 RepID=A0A4R2N799_9PAST|nr:DsrH/TusB family sulfur metabolism protein [Nicoletella semolina]MDH2924688.1 hypothetical protein [Nicoletella semolina]TCP16688.1 tRNA 2-thiouridine synthesizing protein B [Nicoletella semolina]